MVARRLREQDLAAVAGGGDARREVDVRAYVPFVVDIRRAGVQAHAHAHLTRRERPLALRGTSERTVCGGKREEERVPLRIDLDTAVAVESIPQHSAVLGQGCGVSGVPERVEQPGRAVDVGEEERDGSTR